MIMDVQFMAITHGIGFENLMKIEGATFVPSVSEDGILSWTNDRGLPTPEPVNIKGEKGDRGSQGEPGKDGLTPKFQTAKMYMSDGTTGIQVRILVGDEIVDDFYVTDGKTPVKGVDYNTEADRAQMVNDVLATLPRWTGGSY